MIGETYRQKAVQAMFGSARSSHAPATLWLGWLSTGGVELSTSRVRVDNTDAVWGPAGHGVTNTVPLDGGVAGAWIIRAVGLWDAPTGGALVFSADLPSSLTVSSGDPLTVPVGGLVVEVAA